MDKNSITGIVIICAIMFAWMWYSAPSKEEIAKKRAQDSLVLVEKQRDTVRNRQSAIGNSERTENQEPRTKHDSLSSSDSAKKAQLVNKFDVFASAAQDSERTYTIENELLKATVSSKGGRICSVQLKKYRTHDSLPLNLFDKDSSSFGILFDTEHNRTINTGDLYFHAAFS